QLQVGDVTFLLDTEPQKPHEDEVAAALRLFLLSMVLQKRRNLDRLPEGGVARKVLLRSGF
ncbi:MAG: hypothetical protein ABH877_03030, partial [bacterium]